MIIALPDQGLVMDADNQRIIAVLSNILSTAQLPPLSCRAKVSYVVLKASLMSSWLNFGLTGGKSMDLWHVPESRLAFLIAMVGRALDGLRGS